MDGLYVVLAPGSSVIKSDEHTSIIKEPGNRQVTKTNSDLVKFGPKAERQTGLKDSADRPPQAPTGKTAEEKITKHA